MIGFDLRIIFPWLSHLPITSYNGALALSLVIDGSCHLGSQSDHHRHRPWSPYAPTFICAGDYPYWFATSVRPVICSCSVALALVARASD